MNLTETAGQSASSRKAVCVYSSVGVCACVQAKLHQARAETREAAHYFRMNLERIEAENITGSDQLDALIYLAEYAKVPPTCFVHFIAVLLISTEAKPHSQSRW